MRDRRSNTIEGMVNFPVNTKDSSDEGGMFVQLWVIDPKDEYGVCVGTNFDATSSEVFIGSDKTIKRQKTINNLIELIMSTGSADVESNDICYECTHVLQRQYLDAFFVDDECEKSVPLIANILMGSTGWSNSEFVCTYDDLTTSGTDIYDLLKNQYPKADFYLMTFLDT